NYDLLQDSRGINDLQTLTLRWCLENVLTLQFNEPYQYEHRIVRHEDLRTDINIFLDICREFNLEPTDNIEAEYRRPSSKTHSNSEIIDPSKKDKKFNEEEISQINQFLEIFSCNLYPIQSYMKS